MAIMAEKDVLEEYNKWVKKMCGQSLWETDVDREDNEREQNAKKNHAEAFRQ